jgi:hypothetical protein
MNLVPNINMSLVLGRIPWIIDMSDGIRTWDMGLDTWKKLIIRGVMRYGQNPRR